MTAVMPNRNSSPTTSPPPPLGVTNTKPRALSPGMSSPNPRIQQPGQRLSSYAMNRMSQYSTTSTPSKKGSRPVSRFFPKEDIVLPAVRDFAYPTAHPLHNGPPPDASAATSGRSTPQIGWERPLSDPPTSTWMANANWSSNTWGTGEQLAPMAYGQGSPKDHGPPYSEDEDLQSPVVVSSRTRKLKDATTEYDHDRGFFTGTNGDGSETYYVGGVDDEAGGPGGELVTYPPEQARYSSGMLNAHAYQQNEAIPRERNGNLGVGSFNESRYSRDYQFTIASPDEEMHGKAVALFDFTSENDNELPLVEGQIILVSYRHGQGWLVAQDPKTGESGLVPEEYVRLLRDIEGDWPEGDADTEMTEATEENTEEEDTMQVDKKEAETKKTPGHKSKDSTSSDKSKPVVSTFSTSSKDLEPYPSHLLNKTEQPPQVVHYSQANTPTVASPVVGRGEKAPVSRSSSRRQGR